MVKIKIRCFVYLIIIFFISIANISNPKAKVKADKDKKKMSGIKIEGGYGTGCCVYIPNDPSDSPQNQFKDFEEAAASSKYRKCINPVDGDGFICEHCHVFTCIGHQLLHCCTGITFSNGWICYVNLLIQLLQRFFK